MGDSSRTAEPTKLKDETERARTLKDDELAFVSNENIPESIRASYLELVSKQRIFDASHDKEDRQIKLEERKFIWNTPIVAALAGLITLSATQIFGLITAHQATANAVTLAQIQSELKTTEDRLKHSFEASNEQKAADVQSKAREREFEYDVVKQQLLDAAKSNAQRAAILLFLTRAGVLNTLNKDELSDMAKEQLAKPDSNIVPQLSSSQAPAVPQSTSQQTLYMVVIQSFKDEALARKASDDANKIFQDKQITLHADPLAPPDGSQWWGVFVGEWISLDEAKGRAQLARNNGFPDAYVTPGP